MMQQGEGWEEKGGEEDAPVKICPGGPGGPGAQGGSPVAEWQATQSPCWPPPPQVSVKLSLSLVFVPVDRVRWGGGGEGRAVSLRSG